MTDDDPCPDCGIPYDDLPVGHCLSTPLDGGGPQTCEVWPPPDPGIAARWGCDPECSDDEDEDDEPAGVSPIAIPPAYTVRTLTPRELRDEAAAQVLAVLQEQKPQARKRRLPRLPSALPAGDLGTMPYRITWR